MFQVSPVQSLQPHVLLFLGNQIAHNIRNTVSQAWWGKPGFPASLEAEAGQSQAGDLPGLQHEFKPHLNEIVRPWLREIKKRKRLSFSIW